MTNVLVVDDQEQFLDLLTPMLKAKGYKPTAVQSAEAALESLNSKACDVVLADIWMNPMDGMQLLGQVREQHPTLPVIMMTGNGTVETALEALQVGAFDYLTKPFGMADMCDSIEKALVWARDQGGSTKPQDIPSYVASDVVCNSKEMTDLWGVLSRFALTNAPVLFQGEKGVGKRHLARALHVLSGRAPHTYFELSSSEFANERGSAAQQEDGGNLLAELRGCTICFVDVELMPTSVQEEVLAILRAGRKSSGESVSPPPEEQVRIVATTNANLEDYVGQGFFNADLHRVLTSFGLQIPPLRERSADIIPLFNHLLRESSENSAPRRLAADARGALRHYAWPGNVREMYILVESIVESGGRGVIDRHSLPDGVLEGVLGLGIHDANRETRPDPRGQRLRAFLESRKQDMIDQIGKD